MKQVNQLTKLVHSTIVRCLHQPQSVQCLLSEPAIICINERSVRETDSTLQLRKKSPVNSNLL